MRQTSLSISEPALLLAPDSLTRCIACLDAFPDFVVPPGSLNVAFLNPPQCQSLHDRFFADASLTDVMTFPGDPGDAHAGDIAICPAVAVAAAPRHGLSFARELSLYLIHGWLHLAGLDDQSREDQAAMRTAESRLMAFLCAQKALLDPLWKP